MRQIDLVNSLVDRVERLSAELALARRCEVEVAEHVLKENGKRQFISANAVATLLKLASEHHNGESRFINIIKEVRSLTGLQLKEAKDLVERNGFTWTRHGDTP